MEHDDIWDDSALVNSWNEALAEYRKYHSIHAKGENVDNLLSSQDEQRAKPETGPDHDNTDPAPPSKNDDAINGSGPFGVAATSKDRLDATTRTASAQSQGIRDAPSGGATVMPSPESLLGSVQDDGLKRLLMSWYYAGFYTGLHEGQQKHQSQERQG